MILLCWKDGPKGMGWYSPHLSSKDWHYPSLVKTWGAISPGYLTWWVIDVDRASFVRHP